MQFILMSCKDNRVSSYLDKVQPKIKGLSNKNGWAITQELPHGQVILQKTEDDTLKILEVSVVDNEVFLVRYDKTFPCLGNDTCFVAIDMHDTLYFYRGHGSRKFFYVGEYAYKYSTGLEFEEHEFDYFTLHEDSLRKVRGDNLPQLPKLSEK